jgi:hypothetical protein
VHARWMTPHISYHEIEGRLCIFGREDIDDALQIFQYLAHGGNVHPSPVISSFNRSIPRVKAFLPLKNDRSRFSLLSLGSVPRWQLHQGTAGEL